MKRITFASTIGILAIICFIIVAFTVEDCKECFSKSVMAVKFFISGLVIMIGSIYFTKEFLKAEKIIFEIESLPILETDEAADGVPFAGQGVIEPESDKILKSPYTKTPCVYFHFIKEEYVKRGKESYWKIVENIAQFLPFYIKDERGKLRVDLTNLDCDFSSYRIPLRKIGVLNPKNSEIDCETILKHHPYIPRIETENGIFYLPSKARYRISEFILRPGTKVFACGMVSRRDNQLVLHEGERCPLIISRKNRDQYVQEFYRGQNIVYLSHFLMTIGYSLSLLAIDYFLRMKIAKLLLFLFFGNAIIFGSAIFTIYNRIVTLKNRAFNSLSNIDTELKRMAELIPNIVEVVKGYAKHEIEIQKIIAESRAKIRFLKELKREEKPVINSLAAVIESYPDLRASENFQFLMKILVDAEERIAYSREFYNRSVRKYNTLIKQFPFSIVSSILRLKEMDFITISRGLEK